MSSPEQFRWGPQKGGESDEGTLWFQGMKSQCGAGEPGLKNGLGIHQYYFSKNMTDAKVAMYSADGEMLVVPQSGVLHITTEFGKLKVSPKEIVVLPRGVKFAVDLEPGVEFGRGWMVEIYKGIFEIPELGPIGTNGLANGRDF